MNYDPGSIRSEAAFLQSHYLRTAIINTVAVTGITASLYGALCTIGVSKTMLLLTGAMTSTVAMVSSRNGRESLEASRDLRNVSDMSRTARYYEATRPVLEAPEVPKTFDWQELVTKPNLYPHCLIIGASGGGKSTLAENLAGLLKGTTYGAIPHWQVGEFSSCKRIIGAENNVGNGAAFNKHQFNVKTPLDQWDNMLRVITVPQGHDGIVTWSEIEEGTISPTICQAFRALWFEMKRRLKLGDDGRFVSGEPINFICDEFNSLSDYPGLRDIWLDLVREARKVNIRLILIVQQNDVKSLGIEGQGAVRQSLCHIYVGTGAEERAIEIMGLLSNDAHRAYWQATLSTMLSQEHKCIVDKYYAELPKPNQWVTVSPVAPTVTNTLTVPVDTNEIVITSTSDIMLSQVLYKVAVEKANLGWSKGRIIREAWGVGKGDKAFKVGLKHWRKVENEYGPIKLIGGQDRLTGDAPEGYNETNDIEVTSDSILP